MENDVATLILHSDLIVVGQVQSMSELDVGTDGSSMPEKQMAAHVAIIEPVMPAEFGKTNIVVLFSLPDEVRRKQTGHALRMNGPMYAENLVTDKSQHFVFFLKEATGRYSEIAYEAVSGSDEAISFVPVQIVSAEQDKQKDIVDPDSTSWRYPWNYLWPSNSTTSVEYERFGRVLQEQLQTRHNLVMSRNDVNLFKILCREMVDEVSKKIRIVVTDVETGESVSNATVGLSLPTSDPFGKTKSDQLGKVLVSGTTREDGYVILKWPFAWNGAWRDMDLRNPRAKKFPAYVLGYSLTVRKEGYQYMECPLCILQNSWIRYYADDGNFLTVQVRLFPVRQKNLIIPVDAGR
jgi:hypothetical protein